MANEGRMLVYFDELVMALARTYAETMDTHIYSPRDILSSIQGLRPVDAVPVVHGHWKVIEASDELYQCTACGEWQFIPEEHFAYCPYCGAHMDLEVKDA